MCANVSMLVRVRTSAAGRILFLPHAVRQMARPDRMISTREVRRVIEEGEVIEDYPEDSRGHSCLLLGHGEDERPLHVVCAPKEEFLAIITAYLPEPETWDEQFRTRNLL
ncbi:DUF4258 domain-containing protein [bacterium]|nr:DUF4258 domain-containing protein [bacterium]